MEKKNIHLVLSCGGARGLASIGVIEVLEEQGFNIISISGCSMGAVVGGIHAAGFLPIYKNWMLEMTRSKVFGLFDFTLTKKGFIKGDRIFERMKKMIPASDIEHFNIPFIAVATDIYNNSEKWFNSGNLFDALRATVSIPGILTPFVKDEKIYLDGGILNPLPLNTVIRDNEALVLAVNMNDHYQYKEEINNDYIEKNSLMKNKLNSSSNDKKSIGQIIHFSYMMMLAKMSKLSIGIYKPDLVINIPGNACAFYEFYKTAEMIELGRKTCLESLQKFNSYSNMSR